MKDFRKLEGWNKKRDEGRRYIGTKTLKLAGIKYREQSSGCYKIKCQSCHTLMFYPKSGVIIWKEFKRDYQHKFVNADGGRIIRKIKSLIGDK